MSIGYSWDSGNWEGIRQVRATLLGERHIPEQRLCGGCVYLWRYSLLNGSSLRVSSVTLRRTNFFQTVSHRTAEVTPPRQPYSVSITT